MVAGMSDDWYNLQDDFDRNKIAFFEADATEGFAEKDLSDDFTFGIAKLGYGGDFVMPEDGSKFGFWF